MPPPAIAAPSSPPLESKEATPAELRAVIVAQRRRILALEAEVVVLRGAAAARPIRKEARQRKEAAAERRLLRPRDGPQPARRSPPHWVRRSQNQSAIAGGADLAEVDDPGRGAARRNSLIARLRLTTSDRRRLDSEVSPATPAPRAAELATPDSAAIVRAAKERARRGLQMRTRARLESSMSARRSSSPDLRDASEAPRARPAEARAATTRRAFRDRTSPHVEMPFHSPPAAAAETAPAAPAARLDGGGGALWVMHDNPALGAQVADLLRGGRSAGALIEAPEWRLEARGGEEAAPPRAVVMVRARILFSGPTSAAAARWGGSGAARGSQALVLTRLEGFRAVDTRADRVLEEGGSQRWRDGLLDVRLREGRREALGDAAALRAFFAGCDGRVDVILDPAHRGEWYPVRDATRSLAPQFRSRGVGYLRLADDMGRNGCWWLSADAGRSFLLAAAPPTPSSAEHRARPSKSAGPQGRRRGGARARKSRGAEAEAPATGALRDAEVADVVALLRDRGGAEKWTRRAEQLGELCRLVGGSCSSAAACGALGALESLFSGKEVRNALVQRKALAAVGCCFERVNGGTMAAQPSWRPLLEAVLVASRAKGVAEEAVRCLHAATAGLGIDATAPFVAAFAGVGPKWCAGSAAGLSRPVEELLRASGSAKAAPFGACVLEWVAEAAAAEQAAPRGGAVAGLNASRALCVTMLAQRAPALRRAAADALVAVLRWARACGPDGAACAVATAMALPDRVRKRVEGALCVPAPHGVDALATPRGGALAAVRAKTPGATPRAPLADASNFASDDGDLEPAGRGEAGRGKEKNGI